MLLSSKKNTEMRLILGFHAWKTGIDDLDKWIDSGEALLDHEEFWTFSLGPIETPFY